MARPREDLHVRFWSRVKKTKRCWLWTASKYRNGYGQISWINARGEKKNLKAHRVSYELHKGKIPKGLLVCHSCDNTSCVNPKHLFLGTWKDNVSDMIKKGRRVDTSGVNNGQAKITMEIANEIRRKYALNKSTDRYSEKEFSQQKLGKIYGITQAAVGQIIRGNNWK